MERVDNTLADLLPDILSRLPVKSLMQFKCVDKPWCHLIEDPRFIIKHLQYFNGNSCQQSHDLIVKSVKRTKSFVSRLSHNQDHVSVDLLDLPYNRNLFVHLQVLGPCNGIYYLHGYPSSLINPAMREFKALPETHVPPPEGTEFILTAPGFGFDPNADDYKVVLLKLPSDFTQVCTNWVAEVYSLNANCWRQVECPVRSSVAVQESQTNTFVNGAYHWWAYDADESSIIAFDMATEVFRTIKFPVMIDSTLKSADVTVASFKNTLSVILYPPNEIIKHFDIWVMKDYSIESSWVKQMRIEPMIEVERPIGFLRSDEQFVLETKKGKVVAFDVNTNEIKELGIQGESRSLQVLVYEESLVSLKRQNQQQHHAEVSAFNVVADPLFFSSSYAK